MARGKHFKKLIAVLCALIFLTSCGATETTSTDDVVSEVQKKESMLAEAEIGYEKEETYPGIIVDVKGYLDTDDKKALFVGETLPAAFYVMDAVSGESVYRGTVRRAGTADDGKLQGTADFTSVTTAGTYYIQAEILGRSKTFEISENLFEKEATEAFEKLYSLHCDSCHSGKVPFESNRNSYLDVSGGWHTSEDGEKDVVEGCLSVLSICTAYEYYSKILSDDSYSEYAGNEIPDILDEVMYETEWLLKMQNPETGGVFTAVSLQDVQGFDARRLYIGGETTRATAYFAACMAKVSTIIKKYDPVLSQAAFQAATLAWNCLEANKDIVSADQRYRAAVELYRASGSDVYAEGVNNYLKANVGKSYESRLALDAAITYLATPRSTNVEYCTDLMAAFMDRTEEKAESAELNFYGVESIDLTSDELLRNTFELTVVDYIISSNAYVRLEKDYFHYICGRNKYSIDFADKLTTPNMIVYYYVLCKKLSLD